MYCRVIQLTKDVPGGIHGCLFVKRDMPGHLYFFGELGESIIEVISSKGVVVPLFDLIKTSPKPEEAAEQIKAGLKERVKALRDLALENPQLNTLTCIWQEPLTAVLSQSDNVTLSCKVGLMLSHEEDPEKALFELDLGMTVTPKLDFEGNLPAPSVDDVSSKAELEVFALQVWAEWGF